MIKSYHVLLPLLGMVCHLKVQPLFLLGSCLYPKVYAPKPHTLSHKLLSPKCRKVTSFTEGYVPYRKLEPLSVHYLDQGNYSPLPALLMPKFSACKPPKRVLCSYNAGCTYHYPLSGLCLKGALVPAPLAVCT